MKADERHLFLGPGRYLLLLACLLPLFVRRCFSADWIGDFWIYVAAVNELAVHPFAPQQALLGNDYAFAFYSPYAWMLGMVSRLTGLGGFEVLMIQGLLNFVLLTSGLYAFVVTWVGRPRVAFYALLLVLFLWGSDPWTFSSFFHLHSLTYVLPYPSTFAAALAFITLSAFRPLSRGGSIRWVALVAPVAVVVWIVHPVNGLFLWTGLFVLSLTGDRKARHFVLLALLGAATFGLAMAWPLFPVRELWFQQTAMVHGGNDDVYGDAFRRIWPALLAVPWLVVRLRRNRRDPLSLLAIAFTLFYVYGGLSGKSSYGRLISHAMIMLQMAAAEAMVALEDRLDRVRWGRLWRVALPLTVALVLTVRAWPTAVAPTLRSLHHGDPHWLAFLREDVGRHEVVLTDFETCWYVPAFSGKVVAYPMRIPFVPDHEERALAVKGYFAEEGSLETRLATLERYDVRFLLLDKTKTPDWRDRVEELGSRAVPVRSTGDYELLRIHRR